MLERLTPFATYKYHVEITSNKKDKISIVAAAFSECSGLEMSMEVFPYQEGGFNEYVHQLPGRIKYSNVTLKRGFALSNELYKWFKEMRDALMKGEAVPLKSVSIILNNSAIQGMLVRWTLKDSFPVKWVGPSFKADEAALAIESLELAHHGIDVETEPKT
jgi:phage tail-like protein